MSMNPAAARSYSILEVIVFSSQTRPYLSLMRLAQHCGCTSGPTDKAQVIGPETKAEKSAKMKGRRNGQPH